MIAKGEGGVCHFFITPSLNKRLIFIHFVVVPTKLDHLLKTRGVMVPNRKAPREEVITIIFAQFLK